MQIKCPANLDAKALLQQAKEIAKAQPVQVLRPIQRSPIGGRLPELNANLKAAYGGHVALVQELIDYVQELEKRIQVLEQRDWTS
jgi:hypothetical protein